jgi:cobalamin biosynthesis protein CobW
MPQVAQRRQPQLRQLRPPCAGQRREVAVGKARRHELRRHLTEIDGRRTAHDDEPGHDHDDFDSFVVDLPAVAAPEELAARVARAAEAGDVLRVKGFAAVAGKPMRLVVQAVGPRVSHHYDRRWGAGEVAATRLVVIGLKGFDRGAVERILAS